MLREGLAELTPDLVAFQESVVTEDHDHVADLLGPDFHLFHQQGRTDDGVGASMASRWPFVDVRQEFLHVTPRVDTRQPWIGSVALAQVDVPEAGRVLFVNHKPSWQFGFERERELQAVATARLIEELMRDRAMHVVLVGDFDATPEAASVRFWASSQSLEDMSVCYRDAWATTHADHPGHTFTPRNPLVANGELPLPEPRRIDYVFVRFGAHGPTLDVARCDLAFAEPADGIWGSDHFGVAATLEPAE